MLGMLICVGALASCNTQITSLRQAALSATGAGVSGVPPAMTSLTVMDSSPTRNSPLTLHWGLLVGSATEYCILENVTNPAMCIWRTGAPLTSYADSAPDGPLVLTAYFKNAYGLSTAVTSNTVTIDRTPPMLASVSITTASPTNSPTIALSYGAVTGGTYSEYCITTNNTSNAGCTWTAGVLPATYTLTGPDGAKTVSVWIRDVAGNESTRVQAGPIVLDTALPAVAITAPAPGAYVNAANVAAFPISGTCSELGLNVVISGAASATVACTGGAWSTTVDLSAAAQGAIVLRADHSDAAGNAAPQASISLTKDTGVPTVAFTSPAAGSYVNAGNATAFAVSGTCSENGRNVVVSGAGSATIACSGGTWSTTLNLSAAPAGAITLYADHSDAAGNPAVQASLALVKDTTAPTVTITSPAAGAFANSANQSAFSVSGTCSENGRNVVVGGAGSATVACAGGTWSTTVDVSAAADGPFTLTADHSDAAGNPAVQASRSFVKDTGAPTVAITSPAAGSYINNANKAAWVISGTCSENGRNVVLSGSASATVSCAGGTWTKTFDMTAVADGAVTIYADHSDAGGNAATQASRAFVKDTGAPTVAITSPAAGSYINNGNKAAWVISGTCSENGENVVLSGSASATVACSGGAWTKTFDMTAVADGAVTIYADHSDAAGNAATQASRAFVKDTAAPTVAITAPAAGSYINNANKAAWVISGTCSENGQNVVLSGSASSTVTCTAGAWTKTFDMTAVADGAITIYADHSTAGGNAATQASRAFVKDTAAPTVAITAPAAGSYVNAANVAAFGVSGTCSENGQNVVITGSASATVTCLAGTWNANLDFTAAAQGAVTIYADHSDVAGNAATQASRAFVKDTVVPTVAITSPAAGSFINGANKAAWVVSGTCSENGQNVVLSGSASATVSCATGAWTKTFDMTAVADGAVTIYADHSDVAGNAATQASRAFVKNTGVPTVAITAPAAGAYVNNANKTAFAISGTCSENGQNVVLSGAGSGSVSCSSGTWSTTLNVSAAGDGSITIYADHSDISANAAVQASRNFTKDTVNPTVAITSPAAMSNIYTVNMTTFAVSGTCSENGRAVTFSGAATGSATCTAGAWSASLDMSGASDGTVTLYADHSDAAGNTAPQASRNFNKDTGIPTLAISTPAAGSNVNLSNVAAFTVTGTCSENGQNVVITGDASASVACAAGAWTVNLDFSAAAQGSVSITANHSDTSGNAANPQTRSFTKDTLAPTVAITSPAAGSYINNANKAAWVISGTCSENGRNVVLSGSASATVTCTAGAWTKTFDMTGVADGAVTIYADHSDVAGNAATQASRAFVKDAAVPTVAITSPAAGSYINNANKAAWVLSGTCSENGQNVVLSGSASATVTCTAGAWTKTFDMTAVADGAVTIYADHSTAGGNAATQASRAFVKDATLPTVAITSPAAGSYINSSNKAAWVISGTCSENGQNVVLSGSASATVSCTTGTWTKTFDMTAVADGAVTIYADHSDAAGNAATQASRAFVKDATLPTVAITSPAAGSYINSANKAAWVISGTCSENGENVVLSGSASATVSCTTGTWTKTFDMTAVADGAVTIYADHSDAAGNAAAQASRAFVKDAAVPTVAITSPAANSYANASNYLAFTVSGTCSENGRNVTLSGTASISGSAVCTAGAWSATIDIDAGGTSEGAFTVTANHSDAAGNAATASSRNFIRDTVAPTITLTAPNGGEFWTIGEAHNIQYTITDATSGVTANTVTLSYKVGAGAYNAITTTAPVNGPYSWTVPNDPSATAKVKVDVTDIAGNGNSIFSAATFSIITVPTVAITSPAVNSLVGIPNASSFATGGTCSENGRAVNLSSSAGTLTSSATCTAGAWTANLDFNSEMSSGPTPKYANIVGYWKMNGAVGAIANGASVPATIGVNASANNANGTGMAYSTSRMNQGIDLDGVDDQVTIPNTHGFTFGTNPFSVAIWFYKNTGTSGVRGDAFQWGLPGCPFGAFVDYDDTLKVSWPGTGDILGPIVTLGAWHQVVMTREAGNVVKTYLDGQLVSTGSNSFNMTTSCFTTAPVTVGGNDGSLLMPGKIDELAFWNTSLTAAEVLTLYSGQKVPEGSFNLLADHSNAGGTAATQASRAFVKDTIAPDSGTIAIAGGAAYTNTMTPSITLSAAGSPTEMYITNDSTCNGGGAWEAYSTTKASWTLMNSNAPNDVQVKFRDAAGNESVCYRDSITHDDIPPTLAFSSPAANSYVTSANMAAFTITGTCNANGRTVTLSGAVSTTTTCTAGSWSKTVDLTALGQGTFTVYADLSDAAGNNATQKSRSFIKDTLAPTVAITSPAANSYVTTGNMATFLIQGSCSENGRNVVLTGAVSTTATCSGVTWSKTVDFTAAADGNLTIYADHSDAAGNNATQDSRTFIKDTTAPTVAITGPAANTWANSGTASAFAISGTCSENGRTVTVSSGAASNTGTCTAGAFSINLDVTGLADGNWTAAADLTDAAGIAATQSTRAFKKDVVPPTAAVTSPNGGETWYVGETKNITWTSSDALSGVAGTTTGLNPYDGTTYYSIANAPNTGTYSWTVTGAALSTWKISIHVTDVAGNDVYDLSDANFTIATPVAPSVPANLTATPSYGSIALNWNASTGTPTPTYDVLRSTTSGSGYSAIATGLSVTNYTDPNATHGTTFFYVVRATNLAGTSANSTEVGSTSVLNPSFAMDFRLKSYQPQLGTQAFTFARADTAPVATHYGPDGLLRFAPHNYFLRSESLDNATSWYSDNSTITADSTTAPDGTTTADTLNENSANADHTRRQDITKPAAVLPYTFSIYAKAGTRHFIEIRTESGGGGIFTRFDIQSGTYLNNVSYGSGWTYLSSAIEAVGDGWYRISSTSLTDANTAYSAGVRALTGPCTGTTTGNYTGNSSASLYLWGAQAELNRSPSTYLKTTTATRFDGPRYDYDPVTKEALGLRMDENTTNLLLYSEAFDNSGAWVPGNTTVVADATTDPMGGSTADKLVETTANGYHYLPQTVTKAASALRYSTSYFVKAGTRNVVKVSLGSGGNGMNAVFDLSAGTIYSTSTFGTGFTLGSNGGAKIENAGNGWYRVTLFGTSDTSTSMQSFIYLQQSTTTASYVGDTSKYVYIWGAQLEVEDAGNGEMTTSGTNYVPTGSATASRADEFLYSTGGLGAWYQNTGTWYADFRMASAVTESSTNSGTLLRLHTSDSTATADYRIGVKPGNYIYTDRYTTSRSNFAYYRNWVEGGILGVSNFKVAFTINAGDTVTRMNGSVSTSVTTNDTLTVVPTRISIGNNGGTNKFEPFNGWVRELRFYKTRIADADLTSMTSTAAAPGFTDDFDDSSMLAKWVMGYASGTCHWCNYGTNYITTSETSGQLRLSMPAAGAGYDGYVTADTYNFTGAYTDVQIVEPARKNDTDSNNQGCGMQTSIVLFPGSSTTYSLEVLQYLQNGNFLDLYNEYENPTGNWTPAANTSGGAYTSSPTTYKYLRVRHDIARDRLVSEYSNDRWTWTEFASRPRWGSLSAVRIGIISGTWCQDGDAVSSNPAFFDNFRTNAVKN